MKLMNKANKKIKGLTLVEFLTAIGIGGALIALVIILSDLIMN